MRKIVLAAGMVALAAMPGFAQSVKDKLVALTEGLNDPNPIIRIAALDEALADSSSTVRNYAMTQALASEDADLKSMALTKFFETRKQLTIIVKKSEALKAKEATFTDEDALKEFQKSINGTYYMLATLSPSVIYSVKKYNNNTGELRGYCMKNLSLQRDSYTFNSSIIGDKITIEQHCYHTPSSCTLQMQLSDNAKYVGTMRCSNAAYPAVVEMPLK